MADTNNKFENEDLPKILAALKRAKDGGSPARVTVDFSKDGGVVAILLEPKIKIK